MEGDARTFNLCFIGPRGRKEARTLLLEEADLRSYGVCSKMEISNFEFRSANRIMKFAKK